MANTKSSCAIGVEIAKDAIKAEKLTESSKVHELITPFNAPHLTGKELSYIEEAVKSGNLSSNGVFGKRASLLIEQMLGARKVFVTTSGTDSLELAALSLDIGVGDEVIMPSFTFVATASAFVRMGAIPVFVDIDEDTLALNLDQVESAITPKTKAVVPVHYAGISCDMNRLLEIVEPRAIPIVEDAAHGILAKYRGLYLGTVGDLGVLSFHETKNITAGECGALIVNDEKLIAKVEKIWNKGTNRSEFDRGEVSRYTWVELGSSFAPNELTTAFLCAQLESAEEITRERENLWHGYNEMLKELEDRGCIKRPSIPDYGSPNGHIYHFTTVSEDVRNRLLVRLRERGIEAVFHYIPLHSSPAGLKYGRTAGEMSVTDRVSSTLIRLPIYPGLTRSTLKYIVSSIFEFFEK